MNKVKLISQLANKYRTDIEGNFGSASDRENIYNSVIEDLKNQGVTISKRIQATTARCVALFLKTKTEENKKYYLCIKVAAILSILFGIFIFLNTLSIIVLQLPPLIKILGFIISLSLSITFFASGYQSIRKPYGNTIVLMRAISLLYFFIIMRAAIDLPADYQVIVMGMNVAMLAIFVLSHTARDGLCSHVSFWKSMPEKNGDKWDFS